MDPLDLSEREIDVDIEVQNDDKAKKDLTSSSVSDENIKVAEEITFDFKLCDVASHRKNRVVVHMSRNHLNIEQFDGKLYLSQNKIV